MNKKTITKRKMNREREKEQEIIMKDSWSLDYSFLKWIIPRLNWLKENNCGYPVRCGSNENWTNILEEMINGFKSYLDKYLCPLTKEDEGEDFHKSMDLFKEYFSDLWD